MVELLIVDCFLNSIYLVIPSNAEETYAELQGSFERVSDKFLAGSVRDSSLDKLGMTQ
jgi:hypothetical protein